MTRGHRANARLMAALAALAIGLGYVAGSGRAGAQPVTPTVPTVPGSTVPVPTVPGPATPAPAATVPPLPSPSPELSATPTAAPGSTAPASAVPGTAAPGPGGSPGPSAAALIDFTGELLDLRGGYVYFTTADAFKTSPALKLVDLDTGGPTKLTPAPGIFARATLDPQGADITVLALTKRRLPTDAAYRQAYARAHAFVVATSPVAPAPELANQKRLTGRPVAVTFFVQVPPTTPLTDDVFITTDASGWIPNAMKMDRIDALHYRLTRSYASGTKFSYKYTRGSWNSVEVGENGLEDDAHQFFVPEVDAKRLTDVVYRWSDQNPTQQQVGPDSIPTPFNPNPFGNLPSTLRPGQPVASPTPRP